MQKHRGNLTEESKLLLKNAPYWYDEMYECTCGARVSAERDQTGAFVPKIHAIRRGPKDVLTNTEAIAEGRLRCGPDGLSRPDATAKED
jgi:hypothetical protein